MKPPSLGTILPTKSSLALDDAYAAKEKRLNSEYASRHPKLKGCPKVWEKGEFRWILSPTVYATVRNQTAKFFERRKDGDYSVKEPKS